MPVLKFETPSRDDKQRIMKNVTTLSMSCIQRNANQLLNDMTLS
jgi:hypothetical protein